MVDQWPVSRLWLSAGHLLFLLVVVTIWVWSTVVYGCCIPLSTWDVPYLDWLFSVLLSRYVAFAIPVNNRVHLAVYQ